MMKLCALKDCSDYSFVSILAMYVQCMCNYRCHFHEYTLSEVLECWLLLCGCLYTLPQLRAWECHKYSLQIYDARS